MRFKSHLLRRSATAVGAVALSLGGLALIGGPPAGATGGPNPPTTPVAYELDAYNATAGEGVPLVVTTAGLTLTGGTAPLYPQGATYGLSGSISYTAIGALLAGLAANSIPLSFQIGGLALAGDNTATGSYTIPNFTGSNFVANTTTVNSVTYSTGSPVITGTTGSFSAGEVGDGVVGPSGHKTDFQGTQIIAVAADGSTATLSGNPPAAGGSGGNIVLYGPSTLTQLIATPTNAFSTNAGAIWPGNHATTADVNLVSAGTDTIGYTIGGALASGPGPEGNGTPGANEAVITGYTLASAQGPGIENAAAASPGSISCTAATPTLPPGSVFPLQATGCPGSPTDVTIDSASVPLNASGPTANGLNTSLGVGQSGTVQLSCSTVSPSTTSSFALVTTSPQTNNGNTLTFSLNPSTGQLSLNDSLQSGAASIPIQFTCTDNMGLTSSAATINVSLGTPPVVQPFTEQVNGNTLVLSCSSPATYVTGNNTPTPGGNPLLNCPEFQFQPITLDGLEQQVTSSTGDQSTGTPPASSPGTIYISDNRGGTTDSWTLTGTFVATPTGSIASGGNPNTSCAGVVAFCDSSISTAVTHVTNPGGVHDGWILPSYLQVSNIHCAADASGGPAQINPPHTPYNPPNLNPDATPTSGGNFGSAVTLCSASAGQSGGTFLYNATYTLTIPESVYAGDYVGSVQYTVTG